MILLSAILAGSLAYYLISQQPPIYKSETILSTGVIDYTGINYGKDNPFIQQAQVDMRFNNLIEFVTSRRCLNLLGFHLLNHDLAPETFTDGPFRPNVDLSEYQKDDLSALNSLLATKLDQLKPEFELSEDELFFNTIAKEFEYDYEVLKEDHLSIQRMGETDYVRLSFTSENPELSAFAVSKYSKSFIDYFDSLRKGENEETIGYLANSAKAKKEFLEKKQNDLKRYKSEGQLVDLEAQREATVNQIKELEQSKNEARNAINANQKTIRQLEKLMDNATPMVAKALPEQNNASNKLTNQKIINLRKQERELTNNIIDGIGNKRKNQSLLRSVKKQLDDEMLALSKIEREQVISKEEAEDNTIANELYSKHLEAQIALTNAQEAIGIINNKLNELRVRSKSYVSAEAYVLNLEREIEVAKDDYEMVVKKLESERLETNRDESPLTIIEHAQIPEKAESDKKLIFTAFSGVVGGSMATFFIFLLAFLDNTMHSPNQFKTFTGLSTMGNIIKINPKRLDLQVLFSSTTANANLERFKELVRDFRFNLEKVEGGNIFLITSPREDEGKSFLITVVAYALMLKQKRVMVIDTNFKRNTLSTWADQPLPESASIHQLLVDAKLTEHFAVTSISSPFNNNRIESISNSGRSQSPLEGLDANAFQQFLRQLSEQYDYVFLEGAALNNYSDTKELIDFSDNVVAVFSADSTMRQADKDSITFLRSLGDKFVGSVLNRINRKNLG